jgi:hypothetical protein
MRLIHHEQIRHEHLVREDRESLRHQLQVHGICPLPTNAHAPSTRSDDELMFLPYFTWALATGFKPDLSYGGARFHASIKRSYAFTAPDRSSLWCIVSLLAGGAPQDQFLTDCISYNLKVTPQLRARLLLLIRWCDGMLRSALLGSS